jgi:flagellar biogenesis protein FliO
MEANSAIPAISPAQLGWAIMLKELWHRIQRTVLTRKVRRLRVLETLALGERRFLAIVEFDRQEFLLGGSGSSLLLLARLKDGKVTAEPAQPRESGPLESR